MSKVFIISDSGHDFSEAEKYGELVVLSKGTIGKYQITGMFRAFEEDLSASSPEDCILISGPIVLNAIACSMFAYLHGRLNLLVWRMIDESKGKYIYRRLVLERLEKKKGEQDV